MFSSNKVEKFNKDRKIGKQNLNIVSRDGRKKNKIQRGRDRSELEYI